MARFRHHDAAVHEHECGGKVQLVCEEGELVGLAVAIGIFANLDIRLARLAFANETVGIITRLNHPSATALVPRHIDGFHDIRFGGEELQIEIRQHLRVTDAVLRGERRLIFDRLRAVLVIRRLPGQALQRGTRGE